MIGVSERAERCIECTVERFALSNGEKYLQCSLACPACGHLSSFPCSGEEGIATSRRGMRPARNAARPASTAPRIACAIRIG